ncbi:Rne/Rng family ribonuclease [Alkalicoccobacillus murimartini]|uniref:Ribonuclease G n=1 Tax=Alkalicoccobacillus murimartini TaxID=171685 RepID=A0ABT9YJG3_9BACI|nr:Rne/Rng family ribonuclease [Alkalicoccobacillus murimartini]MDQ0207993.1 ribonuclease G [Alkalicoccobacillus murimartini]
MKQLILNTATREKRAAVIEGTQITELMIDHPNQDRIVGNIYKARVEKVLPGMQAAFVKIGREKNAYLYRDDILSYYVSDEEIEQKKNRSISHYIQQGEELIVQVTKEEIGSKGAKVNGVVAVPGHHLVYLPHSQYIAVSKRFQTMESRERWRALGESWTEQTEGLIIRTAAEKESHETILQELHVLRKDWQEAFERAKTQPVPSIIMEAPNFVEQLVRDYASEGIDEIIVDTVHVKQRIDKLLALIHLPDVKTTLYRGRENIFTEYGVDRQLDLAMRRQIWLKSGAFLVFDQTEALTVVDVNSGKFTGKSTLEDTVLKVNLEAAKEIARQLRLRDIGGIILIDFIDVRKDSHKEKLTKALEKELRLDRTQTKVRGLTSLGLMEVTRKKAKENLRNQLTTDCPVCHGTGKVLSPEALAFQIERELWEYRDQAEAVIVELPKTVETVLFGEQKEHKTRLEETLGFQIYSLNQSSCHAHTYNIRYVGEEVEVQRMLKQVSKA